MDMMLPSSLRRLVDHEIDCIPIHIHIQRGRSTMVVHDE
jgi:hypothetical protein